MKILSVFIFKLHKLTMFQSFLAKKIWKYCLLFHVVNCIRANPLVLNSLRNERDWFDQSTDSLTKFRDWHDLQNDLDWSITAITREIRHTTLRSEKTP